MEDNHNNPEKSFDSHVFQDPFETEDDRAKFIHHKLGESVVTVPRNLGREKKSLAESRPKQEPSYESIENKIINHAPSKYTSRAQEPKTKHNINQILTRSQFNRSTMPNPFLKKESDIADNRSGNIDGLLKDKLDISKYESISKLVSNKKVYKPHVPQVVESRYDRRSSLSPQPIKEEDNSQYSRVRESKSQEIDFADEDVEASKEIIDNNYNDKYYLVDLHDKTELDIETYRCKRTITRNLKEVLRYEVCNRYSKTIIAQEPQYNTPVSKSLSVEKTKHALYQKLKKAETKIMVAKISRCHTYLAFTVTPVDVAVLQINPNEPKKLFEMSNILAFDNPMSKQIVHIDWSSDSTRFLTSHIDYTVQVWNLKSGIKERTLTHPEILTSVVFHPNLPSVLATVCKDRYLRVWNASTGKVIDWIRCHDNPTAVQFSPSGKFLVIGFLEGSLEIYVYKKKFNSIFSGNIKKLDYVSNKPRKEKKKKEKGLFSILSRKKTKNYKISEVYFLTEKEFFILSYSAKIRLFSIDKLAILQQYVSKSDMIPECFDYYNEVILIGSNTSRSYFWKKENNFWPAFNPKLSKTNMMKNFSVEELGVFRKTTPSLKNYFCCFMKQDTLDKWNSHAKNIKACFMLVCISVNCEISVIIKRSTYNNAIDYNQNR